ncbi:MFS general substrate transporter [Lecanosticta acicola]|uniref:MFS general substrate transporter n=1 Tax=Lecanosticta acicola TaxID=111012 RepID=A0AAI8Z9H3_9PEZI|nr:MFS general substrate transporter [Lecanosticta acicola]
MAIKPGAADQDRCKTENTTESSVGTAASEMTATRSGSESTMFVLNIPAVQPLPDAQLHPVALKWMMTVIVSLCAAAAPLGSTILMPALPPMVRDLRTTREKVNLSIAFYSLSVAIFPLYWSAFGERFGRRPVYLLSFALLAAFNAASAVSSSVDMFIAFRMLAGASSAAVQSMGAGTLADLWLPERRGHAMGVFFMGPMVAPVVAPLIGGGLTHGLGWRSTQWFLTIYAALLWLILTMLLPETKPERPMEPPTTATKTVLSPRRLISGVQKAWRILLIPVRTLPLFRFLPITLVVWYASITFASYYFLNISIQATYTDAPWGFNAIQTGLMYLPSALGASAAGIFGGRLTDLVMIRKAKAAGRYDEKGGLMLRPQDRIGIHAWGAGIMYPLALLAYGWMARYRVHWMGPCVVMFVYGAGQAVIFNITTTMLTEFTPKKASLGVAMNNLVRNTLACVAAAVSQPMDTNLKPGWMFTLVGGVCLASIVTLFPLKRHAEEWREKMAVGLANFK